MEAICSTNVPVGTQPHWSTDSRPVWMHMHMRTPRPCAHTHTLLCGYGLSTGSTEGLSSYWLRNRSPPTANNNSNDYNNLL